MNKTVTVNIGGLVFHIDENAYERFKKYLESIRQHFTGSEGRDEIMQDIESRIAEMFQERVKDKQVITITDVEEVTGVMGKPEQFGDEEEKEQREVTAGEPVGKVTRKLYRNPDDKIIGGVCSGVAAYFDIEAVWIRLGFAFIAFPIFFNSFFGSALFLYVLLWFIIPEAKNTSEKLQMRGEPVNISNIEKNVVEERVQQSKPGTFLSRLFSAIGEIIRFFFRMIGKIIAVFLLFIGVVVGFAVFASSLAIFKFPGTHYPVFLDHIFPGGSMFTWGLIGAVLILGIPLLAIAFLGARMLFKVKSFPRSVGYTALSLWVIGLIICIYVGARTAGEFRERQTVTTSTYLTSPVKGPIVLKMDEATADGRTKKRYWSDEDSFEENIRLSFENNQLQSKDIKIDILKSDNDSIKLEQRFYARGFSKKDATDRAAQISYSYHQADSEISLPNYFTLNKGEKYRAQKIQIVLYIPEGQEILLDPSLENYLYDIQNIQNILDDDMLGHTWKMSMAGLICLDCLGTERVIGGRPDKFYRKTKSGTVRIDENGVYIEDKEKGEVVKIDSSGVMIKHRGEEPTIIRKK